MVSVWLQFVTFLNMIIVGLLIGISFDFYRVMRYKCRLQRIGTDIFDIIFSILATLLISLVLFYSNRGQFRVYIFLGVGSGLLIYYRLLSEIVTTIIIKLLNLLGRIAGKLQKIVSNLYSKITSVISRLRNWIRSW
ncbi:spore cortex biosynthesis protein YabQ [Halanaerobaculum tunisiense]